jgi:sortase A
MAAEQRRLRSWLERGLFCTGAVCLVWCALVSVRAKSYQFRHRAALDQVRVDTPAAVEVPTSVPAGSVIGSLDIPRLGASAIIAEGDDDATLDVAIGHLPDTPLPWLDGNSALAGHRDTFFRPLRHIRIGDEVRVSTVQGEFRYRVHETRIVSPDDLSVLAPTGRPTLTLITCYPFSYIGTAPQRFIVRAERVPSTAT